MSGPFFLSRTLGSRSLWNRPEEPILLAPSSETFLMSWVLVFLRVPALLPRKCLRLFGNRRKRLFSPSVPRHSTTSIWLVRSPLSECFGRRLLSWMIRGSWLLAPLFIGSTHPLSCAAPPIILTEFRLLCELQVCVGLVPLLVDLLFSSRVPNLGQVPTFSDFASLAK